MPIGWIAKKDVAALLAEAIFNPELAGSSFVVSGLENVDVTYLARKFSIGLEVNITYYSMPPRDFGTIMDKMIGAGAGKGIEEMYKQIADTRQYPLMFSHQIEEVLEKLPVRMTLLKNGWRKTKSIF
jgi:hypothetical protein